MLQITYDVIDYSKNKKPVSVSQIAGSARTERERENTDTRAGA